MLTWESLDNCLDLSKGGVYVEKKMLNLLILIDPQVIFNMYYKM